MSLILDALRRKQSSERDVDEPVAQSRADSVLATLGYGESDIQALQTAGVIRCPDDAPVLSEPA